MYGFARFLRGWTDARLEGADLARFLNLCAEKGVALRRPEPLDDFTLRLRIDRRSLPAAEERKNTSCRRSKPARTRRLPQRCSITDSSISVN